MLNRGATRGIVEIRFSCEYVYMATVMPANLSEVSIEEEKCVRISRYLVRSRRELFTVQ